MIRLFVDTPLKSQSIIPLDEKRFHYLCHVMRCQAQDEILCFNGQDGEWLCSLELSTRKSATLKVLRQTRPQKVPTFCALCPALIKKDNMDLVLQKATELGVTDIYPLITEHTSHANFNQAHANLIVQEAAEQCERLTLPIVHEATQITSVLKKLPQNCTRCCLAERNDSSDSLPTSGPIAFFVGPEGGWSQKEIHFFSSNAFVQLHFDVGILRAETASIAILSCWQIGRHLHIKK